MDQTQRQNSTNRREILPDAHEQIVPYSCKEFISPADKQVVPDAGKQIVISRDGLEATPYSDTLLPPIGGRSILPNNSSKSSKRRWIALGGTLGLLMVLAAVLGGVLGSRHKSSTPPPLQLNTNLSASAVPARPSQRSIAAFTYALDSVNNTYVYFQDNAGQIMEASISANNTAWGINGTNVIAKNGSAIAATVSRPGAPLEMSVFYLDVDNLIHDINYTPTTGLWNPGTLASHNYIAMPNTSLAALYNECTLCVNSTIIAYQDENGFVQIGNLTSDGWTLRQLGAALDPAMGTGLALQPFFRIGEADQINLYHQKSNLSMALASWKPAGGTWSLHEQIYETAIPSGSPIAAASSFTNVSTGSETWIQVLSLSSKGIAVNTWSGAIEDWLEQYEHPSMMANATNHPRIYGSLAVTTIGDGFSVVMQNGSADTIEHWQVANSMLDWNFVGAVDLHDVWG